jgi:hypothetical protein
MMARRLAAQQRNARRIENGENGNAASNANKHGVSKSNMAKSSKNSARNGNKSMAKANGEKQHGSKRWRR